MLCIHDSHCMCDRSCDKLQGTTHQEALSSYSSLSGGGGGDDDDDSYYEEVGDGRDEMDISTAKENAIWTDDLVR